ncbi:MAG: cache domain-containing protein [Verrucomicrobiaceae bacterium]
MKRTRHIGFASRLGLMTAGIIALVIGGMLALALVSGRDSVRAAQRAEISGVALLIRHSIDRASFFALAQAETLARQPGVVQGIAERDREGILSRLQTTFAYLRAETGVEVLQFHQADFRNLVRLQDIARHGDDVSKSRPIVVAAIRSGRSQRGLEVGPSGALLRGTAPVMRDGVLLGIAEVGLSMNPLLQSVKQATGAEVGVVLSNAMAGGGAGTDVTVQGSTNAALFAALTKAPDFRLSREAIHLEISVDGTRHALVVEPLLDFSGRMIGSVVGAANVDSASRAFDRDVLILCFAGVAGIIVAFSVLWVAMMGFLVRPMEAMAAHAERLAAGEVGTKPPEIGGAQVVHRLHAALLKLAKAVPQP